eukprot:756365-Hanusia_phi.AAC.1
MKGRSERGGGENSRLLTAAMKMQTWHIRTRRASSCRLGRTRITTMDSPSSRTHWLSSGKTLCRTSRSLDEGRDVNPCQLSLETFLISVKILPCSLPPLQSLATTSCSPAANKVKEVTSAPQLLTSTSHVSPGSSTSMLPQRPIVNRMRSCRISMETLRRRTLVPGDKMPSS